MLRKLSWLLFALLLSSCTLNSEPQPQPVCPTCAAASPCPVLVVPTATPFPTNTLQPTETPIPPTSTPTAEPNPELTVLESPLYSVEDRFPILVKNFAHPEKACDWLGVGGQVLTAANEPVDNLVVVVSGVLNNTPVNAVSLTGTAVDYGPGGFEVQISEKPVASQGSLYLQLYDLNGSPVSNPFTLNTSADCNENLILLNFQQK